MLTRVDRDRDFDAYGAQIDALHLEPWQDPPCVIDLDDVDENNEQGAALLRRMLAAGVSRYDPDPMRALERAEGKS
jgi:hypothetical protein